MQEHANFIATTNLENLLIRLKAGQPSLFIKFCLFCEAIRWQIRFTKRNCIC